LSTWLEPIRSSVIAPLITKAALDHMTDIGSSSPAPLVNNLLYECGDGLLFDVEKEMCDWEDTVECTFSVEVRDNESDEETGAGTNATSTTSTKSNATTAWELDMGTNIISTASTESAEQTAPTQ
jgi:hypothetical protein